MQTTTWTKPSAPVSNTVAGDPAGLFPFSQVNHITIYGNGGNDEVHAYSMSNLVTFINPTGTGNMRMQVASVRTLSPDCLIQSPPIPTPHR